MCYFYINNDKQFDADKIIQKLLLKNYDKFFELKNDSINDTSGTKRVNFLSENKAKFAKE